MLGASLARQKCLRLLKLRYVLPVWKRGVDPRFVDWAQALRGCVCCELCSNPWRVVAICAGREGHCADVGLGLTCGMYTSLPTQPLETHDELEPCT